MGRSTTSKASAEKEEQNRMHISYSDSIREKLEQIKSETDKTSMSEVFRQAVMLYTFVYDEHKKGSDILIRSANGEIERLKMFW